MSGPGWEGRAVVSSFLVFWGLDVYLGLSQVNSWTLPFSVRLPEIQTLLALPSQVEYVCKTKALFTPPEGASSLSFGTRFIDEGAGFGEGLISPLSSVTTHPGCPKDMGEDTGQEGVKLVGHMVKKLLPSKNEPGGKF